LLPLSLFPRRLSNLTIPFTSPSSLSLCGRNAERGKWGGRLASWEIRSRSETLRRRSNAGPHWEGHTGARAVRRVSRPVVQKTIVRGRPGDSNNPDSWEKGGGLAAGNAAKRSPPARPRYQVSRAKAGGGLMFRRRRKRANHSVAALGYRNPTQKMGPEKISRRK